MKVYTAYTPKGSCEVVELNGKYELLHTEDYEKFLFEPIGKIEFKEERNIVLSIG